MSEVRRMAGFLKGLSEPLALRLFMMMKARGPLSVSNIVRALRAPPVSQPTVSKQLRRMRQYGLVGSRRAGRARIYAVRPEATKGVVAACALLQRGEEVANAVSSVDICRPVWRWPRRPSGQRGPKKSRHPRAVRGR